MQQASSEAQKSIDMNVVHQGDVDEAKGAPEHVYESHQISSQILPVMNGGLPPQQVYVDTAGGMVHPGMAGLESQFQALGFRQEEASSTEPSSSQTNPTGEDDDDNEGEDDPVKLFVGQVRASCDCLGDR